MLLLFLAPLGFSINSDKDSLKLKTIDCLVNKSIIPGFVSSGYYEIWKIIKWKRNDFWITLNYNGNVYETHLNKLAN